MSWINWPSGLLSTYRKTHHKKNIYPIFYCFSLIILNDDLKCITLHLIYCVCAQKVTEKIMSWSSISRTLLYCYTQIHGFVTLNRFYTVYYLQFSLLGFVDHLRAVTQDVAVENPEVLNVLFDNVAHLRFIFSNYHPEIP